MIFDVGSSVGTRRFRKFSLSPQFLSEYEDKQPKWGYGGLSYFTYKRTYSRPLEDGATEEFWQTCQRVVEGVYNTQKIHCRRLNLPWNEAKAQKSAQEMFERIWAFKWTPPGRGLWMMGTDTVLEKGSASLNNCSYIGTDNLAEDFAGPFCFLMDNSMLGVGVGGDTRGAGKVKIFTPKNFDEVYVVDDSREGWVAVTRQVLDSFVGKANYPAVIDFNKIRRRGSPIRGFGGVASGPTPLSNMLKGLTKLLVPEGVEVQFEEQLDGNGEPEKLAIWFEGEGQPYRITSTHIVDVFNMIGACVVAGGLRRSAEIMLGDPEDMEFLNLKNPAGLNALSAERAQVAALVENGDTKAALRLVELDDAIENHPLRTHRWCSNNSVIAKVGMDYSDVAERLATNGEPGLFWIENAQAYGRMNGHPDNKDYRVQGTNPCVTGDTLIFTTKGPVPAEKLLKRPFDAVVENEVHHSPTGVFQTGVQPVFLVQTKEGHSVKVTANHQMLTAPKVTRKKRYELWVEARDLSPGDKLILNNTREVEGWDGPGTEDLGWLLGSVVGDGTFDTSNETALLRYWGAEKAPMLELALAKVAELGGDPRYHKIRTGMQASHHDLLQTSSRQLWVSAPEYGVNHDKTLHPKILTTSSRFQRGFLRGLFDADGSVQGSQEKGISVRLASSTIQHLHIAQKMLLGLGINSTLYRERGSAGTQEMPDGQGGEKSYFVHAKHELVVSNDNLLTFAQKVGFDTPSKAASLEGKLSGFKRKLNRERFVSTVQSVDYVGVEPVFDCTVNTVHRFGAEGITVHNCAEISLESAELCNLAEVYPANHDSYEDLERTLKYAYLYAKSVSLIPSHDPRTNAVMMRNRRVGVSMSGIRQATSKHGFRTYMNWCDEGYGYLKGLDRTYSGWLCVPRSIRLTTVKPSGTVSILSGSTPGIHAAHSEFYIRNVRVAGTSPLVEAARKAGYLVEKDVYAADTFVVSFPVKSENFDKGKKDCSIWEQTALAAAMQRYWSDNSVSITVTFKKEEGGQIEDVLNHFEDKLKTISFLPLSEHGYEQAPYIEIDEATYEAMVANIQPLDFGSAATHDISAEDKFCDGDKCELPPVA